VERKLAVILVADIVGYSAQMERDEAGTHARVTERRRQVFEPEIARHQGRIFKLVGDGLLAEFGSAVQAVECAMALQTGLAVRNAEVPEDQRILARIGINLGEVIVEGDDRFGEGVNIAARLEQLAEPGGICVSAKVAREVERKLAFGFVSMGERRVKNIAAPIHVYRVSAEAGAGPRLAAPGGVGRRWLVPLGVVALLVACALGAVLWLWPPAPRSEGPPVLAVLPFGNLTGDPALEYLGLSVPDGVLTILSSSPVLRVVSRSASLTTPATDPTRQVAWRLGADYVLEGSIRRGADGLDVSARLLDGATGDQVWSGAQSGQGDDVAGLQAAVARDVYLKIGSARPVLR